MKLSIITVNRNNLAGLNQTVESVLGQTWRDFEYIVIDGASTDGSAEYLKERSGDFSYWVSEPDRGCYHAMNKGIEKATGEYLLFLNSGDYLADKNILEQAQTQLTGEGIIYGDLIYFERNHKQVLKTFPDQPDIVYLYDNYIPHPSAFIKRGLFQTVGLYNEKDRITSDWQFFMKAMFEFRTDYKHINLAVSVYDVTGISSDPANIKIKNREKENFVRHNPWILNDDFFHSINEARNLLIHLADSRIIKLITSLGFLNYLRKYISRIK